MVDAGYRLTLKAVDDVPMTPISAMKDLLDFYDRKIERKGEAVIGMWVEPSARRSEGDATVLEVRGETREGMKERCRRIGRLRVEHREYELKRCQNQKYTALPGTVRFRVPAADAAKLPEDAQIFVVFPADQWTAEGTVRTVDGARLVVARPGPRRT